MDLSLTAISSYSILIPGLIGAYTYKKARESFHPFFYFIWVGCLNEVISMYLVHHRHYTLVNNNLYVLLEALLLLWLFKKKENWFFILSSMLLLLWLIETFFIRGIEEVSLYFRISYSFVLVIVAIR